MSIYTVNTNYTLDPDKKALWVNALRSGDYSQVTSRLHTSHGFCCLGVACDLYRNENPEYAITQYGVGDYAYFVYGSVGMHTDMLPDAVMDWLGIASANPAFNILNDSEGVFYFTLTELNDSGFTFSQIADIIDYMF